MAPRTYLDNAATSFPKAPGVWDAFRAIAEHVGAPAGRSSYDDAARVDAAIERARIRVGRFFGAPSHCVAFTLNATDALNMAIRGLLRPERAAAADAVDHVVTTALEHNSVRRPVEGLRRRGAADVTVVAASPRGEVDPDDIARAIGPRTRLVAFTHASNVCGTVLPIREIAAICREREVLCLVDAAQTAGTMPIDLAADGIDLLAVPGHKGLLGPPGTGALILRHDAIDIAPWREGGTGTASDELAQPQGLPMRLEAGSPNAPGVVALAAGIEYLETRGLDAVGARCSELTARLVEGLLDIPGVAVPGPAPGVPREPVVSIVVGGWHPHELASALDASFGVQTRSGLHCAPGAHQALGTHPDGTCRLSPGLFTTDEEIDAAIEAVRALAT